MVANLVVHWVEKMDEKWVAQMVASMVAHWVASKVELLAVVMAAEGKEKRRKSETSDRGVLRSLKEKRICNIINQFEDQ